jgi:signal transduction histidine kinase
LVVAFLGIHLPLIGLVGVLLFKGSHLSPWEAVGIVLVFTLVATALTLLILHRLLVPLRVAQLALKRYIFRREVPNLPRGYSDEAGILLSDLQQAIEQLEKLLQQRHELTSMLSHDLSYSFRPNNQYVPSN